MKSEINSKIKGLFSVSFFDSLYKTLTFGDFFIATFPFCLKLSVKWSEQRRNRFVKTLKKKSKIIVAFFLQSPSVWKYDRLYWLFEKSERFEPVVVITPFNVHLNYDKGEMRNVMKQSEESAKKSGYRYFQTFDSERNKWLDIRKTLNPDIIFYTKPYKDTLPQYHIYRFPDKLNCYAPYGMMNIDIFRIVYNLPFHNLLWRFFVETEYQAGYSREYQTCGGTNTVVSGSLGMEPLMLPDYKPVDVWKPQSARKKRIIWAPHHTVDYLFNFSNFFTYCDFMFELAEKYKDEIQIAFKPHPVLKFKLINIWGTNKTEAYYQRWRDLPNGQLEEGYYADLFHGIHALFVANGIQSKSHHGTNAQFHQHFVKTGIIEPKFGHFIAVMENMREKADYDVIYDVAREELEALKPLAYALLEQIEKLLSDK